jgi:hypothetical protein
MFTLPVASVTATRRPVSGIVPPFLFRAVLNRLEAKLGLWITPRGVGNRPQKQFPSLFISFILTLEHEL